MKGRTDRKLRRPVAVDQPDPRLCAGQHFFSAHHYVSKLQIRILVHHGHADLSGHGERRDMMPLDVIPHPGHIPAQLIRKDMYRASGGQRADQVIQRSVKGKAGMYSVDAVTVYSKVMGPPGRERAERAMTLYNALRLSGGARCIDHISALCGRRAIHRCCIRVILQCAEVRLLRHHGLRLRILQYIRDALLRIVRIDRHIGSSRFLDADNRRHERLHTVHSDRDKAVLLHAVIDQISRHRI